VYIYIIIIITFLKCIFHSICILVSTEMERGEMQTSAGARILTHTEGWRVCAAVAQLPARPASGA
jgi:hypothetical protein